MISTISYVSESRPGWPLRCAYILRLSTPRPLRWRITLMQPSLLKQRQHFRRTLTGAQQVARLWVDEGKIRRD